MEEVTIIGGDLAKDVFQRHGAATDGKPSLGRKSRPLRHLPLRKASPHPATAGFFLCF